MVVDFAEHCPQQQPACRIRDRHVSIHVQQLLNPKPPHHQVAKDQLRELGLPDLRAWHDILLLALLLPLDLLIHHLLRRQLLPLPGSCPCPAPPRAPWPSCPRPRKEIAAQQARDPGQGWRPKASTCGPRNMFDVIPKPTSVPVRLPTILVSRSPSNRCCLPW